MPLEVISEPVLKVWNDWELRGLVLLSLTLQLSLFHFGRQRRYSVKARTHIFLWFCYLVADSVATVTLGVISCKVYSCGYNHNNSQLKNEFIAFWAPFMLLHLGGQDTITAYAVQDNELWLRHFLGLVVQSGVAFYIFVTSWKGSWLPFVSIPMIVAGFIKYAERIWVMRSANRNPKVDLKDTYRGLPFEAHRNFQRFRPLFLNQNIHYIFKRETSRKFREYDYKTAFKMIEIELGHAYDDFYTKTLLFFTRLGAFSRCITFSSIVFVFVFFLVSERHKHLQVDLIITYILLGGAVVIEIYALILLINSDRGRLWLETYIPSERIDNIDQLPEKQRWSNSMGQFNMVIFFSKNKPGIAEGKPKFFAELKVWFYHHILPELNLKLEKNFYMTNKQISNDLKSLVWRTFLEKLNLQTPGFFEDYNVYICQDKTLHLEIHESIIIWHVATDLCFYNDNDINDGIPANEANEEIKKDIDTKKKVIKEVSDYMMYILAFCPFLLSAGSAKITFKESCEWLRRVHKGENFTGSAMSAVFDKLIERLSRFREPYVREYRQLHYALLVATNLQTNEQKWQILTRFWIENLAYVATICQGNNHAQLLRKGGECLTQVWFLIEHLDLHERFRMPLRVPEDEE